MRSLTFLEGTKRRREKGAWRKNIKIETINVMPYALYDVRL